MAESLRELPKESLVPGIIAEVHDGSVLMLSLVCVVRISSFSFFPSLFLEDAFLFVGKPL